MAGVSPRVPYTQPRWLRGDTLLFAVVGFVLASAAPLTVAVLRLLRRHVFDRLEPEQVLLPAVCSGLLVVLPMLMARSVPALICAAVLGGPLAGALAGASTALGLQVAGQGGIAIDDSTLLGVPFGAAFAALLTGPASAAVSARLRPAHDGFDRLLIAIGIWLTPFYGVAALALGQHQLMALTWVGLAGGLAALAAGGARQTWRKAWFERVRAGREHDWVLRDWNAIPNAAQLPPLFGKAALDCDALLVHVGRAPGSAYRGKRAEIAVLLAPGPAPRD